MIGRGHSQSSLGLWQVFLFCGMINCKIIKLEASSKQILLTHPFSARKNWRAFMKKILKNISFGAWLCLSLRKISKFGVNTRKARKSGDLVLERENILKST